MKYDEFAFLNQQLAAMLHEGIPLEGALRRLCTDLKQGALKSELKKLEADLTKGVPLREAMRTRQLPELYRQMIEVGAQSNNLPAVLTLLADHYQRRHTIWTRLKGLMVYPVIVLIGAFLLSCFLSYLLHVAIRSNFSVLFGNWTQMPQVLIGLWVAPFLLAVAVVVTSFALATPPLRRALRWRLPAFKEASLSQVASAMSLMLKNGVPLDPALALMQRLEQGTPAGTELAQWRQRLSAGQGKFAEMAHAGRAFPPLFIWMVAHAGEDLASGFRRAADIYQARAQYRTEMLLYSAMPCSVLGLGFLIITQIQPVFSVFVTFMRTLAQ
jgi:type IV pilus assembly protein PilC